MAAIKLNIVGFTIGILLMLLGLAELIPAFVDWLNDHKNAGAFLLNALFSLFIGGMLFSLNRNFEKKVSIRQAFLLTSASWFFMSLFAAFPLFMTDLNLSFIDAFFEATSGITTTGSTVLSGLDDLSHGILIWRSMIQWIGGIGLIGFAIVFLPYLRIGGMQLFQTESSDASEKVMPRTGDIAVSLFKVYCALTALCALTYYFLGMSGFDAINHALTTLPTGGYSTHDASFGYFESPSMQYAASFFMLLGGLPFVLYIKLVFQGKFAFFNDDQFKAILAMLLAFISVLSFWLWWQSDYSLGQSVQYAVFNVVSVITTTGYATTDYTLWGPFAVLMFFFLTYLGACAGSTTGGLKVMRLVILSKAFNRQLKGLVYPHGVFSIRYQGKPVDNYVVLTVFGFTSLYVVSNVALTIALSWTGLDFPTAISGAATAIANVGPGIGETIGPAGNFSSLPDSSKWVLCAGMLLGRLEILTAAVLLTAEFWRN